MSVKKILISPVVLPEFRIGLYNRLNADPELDITISHGSLSMPVFKGAQKKKFREVLLDNKEIQLSGFSLIWQKGLLKEIVRGNYDIFIAQGNFGILTTYLCLIYQWIKRKKNMVWMCAYERPGIKGGKRLIRNFITGRILKLFTSGVAYSSHAKSYLIDRGMSADRINIIGNTNDVVSLNKNIKGLDKEVCRQELGLEKHVILFIGKFTVAKKIDLLIYAMHELVNSMGRCDLKLVLVGNGPARQVLENLATKLNLKQYVRFEGVVIQGKEKYFKAASVAVMPGSGGLMINDCMAARLPIILAYSDGTHLDLILDGETGILFEKDNVTNLAEKIVMMIENKELQQKIKNKAEKLILAKYSLDKMSDNFINAIKQA